MLAIENMIAKRLLRFALGRSFLVDDLDSDDASANSVSLYKARQNKLHEAQTHVLRSLGVYAGQIYRLPEDEKESKSLAEQSRPSSEQSSSVVDPSVPPAKATRSPYHWGLFTSFLFLSSMVGSVCYDCKMQALVLEQGSNIFHWSKNSIGLSQLFRFAASYGVSTLTDALDVGIGSYFKRKGINLDDPENPSVFSSFKECLLYPFRELHVAQSLRITNVFDLFPDFSAFATAVTSPGKYFIVFAFMNLSLYRTFVTAKGLAVFNRFFRRGEIPSEDLKNYRELGFDLENPNPEGANTAQRSRVTLLFAKAVFSECFVNLFYSTLEILAARLIVKLYLNERNMSGAVVLVQPFYALSFKQVSQFLAISVLEWTLQYQLLELFGLSLRALEYFHS